MIHIIAQNVNNIANQPKNSRFGNYLKYLFFIWNGFLLERFEKKNLIRESFFLYKI